MAWSTPSTWVAGAVLTAAQLNAQLRDNLNAAFPLGVDAWTSYSPTLTQSGSVTKTDSYAKYRRIGRDITGSVVLSITGAGTGANSIVAGLPVASTSTSTKHVIGAGNLIDTSANLNYGFVVCILTATTVAFLPTSTDQSQYLGVGVFTAALASGDFLSFHFNYEST